MNRAARVQVQFEFSQHRTRGELKLTKSNSNSKILNSLTRELARTQLYIFFYFDSKITYVSLIFYYSLRKIIILFLF